MFKKETKRSSEFGTELKKESNFEFIKLAADQAAKPDMGPHLFPVVASCRMGGK